MLAATAEIGQKGRCLTQGGTMKSYETVEDACSIAADVLAGSVDPNTGCALIASIAAKLNYPPDLEPFAAIAHDQEGHEAFGITAESCIDDIVHACGRLIAGQSRGA
jgi:hypothetical protein